MAPRAIPPSIDFALVPQSEPDTFRVIVMGDTGATCARSITWRAMCCALPDVGAAFATLGDIVFNDLSVFEWVNRAIGRWTSSVRDRQPDHFLTPSTTGAGENFERVRGVHASLQADSISP